MYDAQDRAAGEMLETGQIGGNQVRRRSCQDVTTSDTAHLPTERGQFR